MTELYNPNSSEKPKVNLGFMKEFATDVNKHFEACEQSVEKIQVIVTELKQLFPDKISIIEALEEGFERKNNLCVPVFQEDTSQVKEINQEVMTGGVSSHLEIQRRLGRDDMPEKEKIREFKRFTLGRLQYRYAEEGLETKQTQAGLVLIFLEELKNIDRFINSEHGSITSVAESTESMIRAILQSAKKIGIEYNHVPLFENFETIKYPLSLTSVEVDQVHKNVSGLQKNTIMQVHRTGHKTDFTHPDDERTVISVI